VADFVRRAVGSAGVLNQEGRALLSGSWIHPQF